MVLAVWLALHYEAFDSVNLAGCRSGKAQSVCINKPAWETLYQLAFPSLLSAFCLQTIRSVSMASHGNDVPSCCALAV